MIHRRTVNHQTRNQCEPNVCTWQGAAGRRLIALGLHLPVLMFAAGAVASQAQAQDANRTTAPSYDWTGFYLGAHVGNAWGHSSWTAGPGINGSTNLSQGMDSFDEGGSWFVGLQGGYNYTLSNHVLLGAELDMSFPSWPTLPTGVNPFGVSIGGSSTFSSPTLGTTSFAETVLTSGTVRGRIGYASGKWLFYATGGFAWTYNQQSLTQVSTGESEAPFLWRLGWAAGAGVEAPIAPHWTARLEYLFIDYGKKTTAFFGGAQPVSSDFTLQELRFGLNYRFGGDDEGSGDPSILNGLLADNSISIHGQSTFVWQGYPPIRSPYEGAQSLPGGGEGRETYDATLYAGLRLWQGAELWVNPEIDQGFGFADTHGAAGFPSAESYKLGAEYPYARFQRYFIRQTINLGGETQKIDADINQFAGSQTENHLVLTVGKFAVTDIFDTNQYANNPKTDFLNWSLINTGTFD